MEIVRIHEKNYDIVLFLDTNNYYGYKFNKDNTIEKIDRNVFKYFDFLTCSNNFSVLPNIGDYKVVLDNNTNFKHFFKNDSEDYEMFFLNNGKEIISYQSIDINRAIRNISKAFIIGSTTVCLSLGAINLVNANESKLTTNAQPIVVVHQEETSQQKVNEDDEDKLIARVASSDITYEDVVNLINSSNNLSKEEKEFLINKRLIEDVLKMVNTTNITKYDVLTSLKDLSIEQYSSDEDNVYGYYKSTTPNKIYVKNYNGINSYIKDTISHEYIHLYQYHYCEYEVLKEATAEIISDEYFEESRINAYNRQVIIVKKLMEIIGPEPVWQYTFTGDFSLIEKNIKPYLSEDQYKLFTNCLSYNYDDDSLNEKKFDNLDILLGIIYNNKYNKNIKEDEIISLYDNPNVQVRRYYFNKDYINQDNSYYEDGNNITTTSMTPTAAVVNEYVYVEEEIKEYITNDQIQNYLKTHDNKGLIRHCSYIKNFKEESAKFKDGSIIISGYLDDKYIKEVSEDELVKKGIIIKCEYYYVKDKRYLSTEEYLGEKYDKNNQLNYIINKDKCYNLVFNNEGDFEIYQSSIVSIPTINEKFGNDRVR